MIVKIKNQVHEDAEPLYGHFKGIEFTVADPFYEIDFLTVRNGDWAMEVLREDVDVIDGRMPTLKEITEGRWLPKTPQKVNFQPCDPQDED